MSFQENLITRSEWGARPPTSVTPISASAIRFLAVHYTASNADEQVDHKNCAARVRGIQNYHMDTQEWSDIAYNWVFCKHGAIFQGRGNKRRSAATGPANGYTLAACFLGDDTQGRDDVTPLGKVALMSILAFVRGYTGRRITAKGHRDFMSTSCPGDQLYAFLKVLNA